MKVDAEIERLAARFHRTVVLLPGGHLALRRDGASQVVCPATPSDYRWLRNTVRDLKASDRLAAEAAREAKEQARQEQAQRCLAERQPAPTARRRPGNGAIRALARVSAPRAHTPAVWIRSERTASPMLVRAATPMVPRTRKEEDGPVDLPRSAAVARLQREIGLDAGLERKLRVRVGGYALKASESDLIETVAGSTLALALGLDPGDLHLVQSLGARATRHGAEIGIVRTDEEEPIPEFKCLAALWTPTAILPPEVVTMMGVPEYMLADDYRMVVSGLTPSEGFVLVGPTAAMIQLLRSWTRWIVRKGEKPKTFMTAEW